MQAVETIGLTHSYKGSDKPALRDFSLAIPETQMFGLLGPNGGGKTTLFKILSTLMIPTSGRCEVFGRDVMRAPDAVRRDIGVVFQAPSLDVRLTVRENLTHQGHLYGLRGSELRGRIEAWIERLGMEDKADALVLTLSGGQKRRVEIAKGLLHSPRLLLLDEPGTGLDPAIRREMLGLLQGLQKSGVTVVLTTHILEEAEACQRLAIVDQGTLVAQGSAKELRQEVGGDVLLVESDDNDGLCEEISRRFRLKASVFEGCIRIETARAQELVPKLGEAFGGRIDALHVGRPTLEDVFIQKTGHRLRNGQ